MKIPYQTPQELMRQSLDILNKIPYVESGSENFQGKNLGSGLTMEITIGNGVNGTIVGERYVSYRRCDEEIECGVFYD